ncbi:hypothetical protein BGX38DRAFT_1194991, partial [Terfezia claveryi]
RASLPRGGTVHEYQENVANYMEDTIRDQACPAHTPQLDIRPDQCISRQLRQILHLPLNLFHRLLQFPGRLLRASDTVSLRVPAYTVDSQGYAAMEAAVKRPEHLVLSEAGLHDSAHYYISGFLTESEVREFEITLNIRRSVQNYAGEIWAALVAYQLIPRDILGRCGGSLCLSNAPPEVVDNYRIVGSLFPVLQEYMHTVPCNNEWIFPGMWLANIIGIAVEKQGLTVREVVKAAARRGMTVAICGGEEEEFQPVRVDEDGGLPFLGCFDRILPISVEEVTARLDEDLLEWVEVPPLQLLEGGGGYDKV